MKNKVLLFIFLAVSLQAMAGVTVSQKRLAVDTVTALDLINLKIAEKNRPAELTIAELEISLPRLESYIAMLNNKLYKLHRIETGIDHKIKDRDRVDYMISLLPEIIDYTPADTKYSLLIKPEKLKKAQKKREVNKLIEKELKALLNKVNTGDFTHPFLRHAIPGYKQEIANNLARLEQEKEDGERKLAEAKGKIQPRVKQFSKDSFLEYLGSQSVPTRYISETVSYHYPEMAEEYDVLVKRYYDTPEKLLNFRVTKEATGKFDGIITDTIGMFPLESMTLPQYDYDRETTYYNGIMLKSKNNTVAPLIIYRDALTENTSYYDVSFSSSSSSAGTLSVHILELITGVWEKGGQDEDGICMLLYPNKSANNDDFMFIYQDGRWQRTVPLMDKTHLYAAIELTDDRILMLKTDGSIAEIYPEGSESEWLLDAIWCEGEDGTLVIYTAEGTCYWSVIGDYIYEGSYHDGKCWNEKCVGGDKGGLDDVGYVPNRANGTKLKSIRFYKDRDKYRKMINLNTNQFILHDSEFDCRYLDNHHEIEKMLKSSGFVLDGTKNVEVMYGTDGDNMGPAVEKLYKRHDCEITFTALTDPCCIGEIVSMGIIFKDKVALDRFVFNMKRDGWTSENGCGYYTNRICFLSIYIDGNYVGFDIGP